MITPFAMPYCVLMAVLSGLSWASAQPDTARRVIRNFRIGFPPSHDRTKSGAPARPCSGFRLIPMRLARLYNHEVTIRILVAGFVCVASLCGQRGHHFSWQDACFKNPGAPYCQGRDYAVKRTRPGKDAAAGDMAAREGATDPLPSTPQSVTP